MHQWNVLACSLHKLSLTLSAAQGSPNGNKLRHLSRSALWKKSSTNCFSKKKKRPLSFDKSIKYTLRLCAGRTQPAQSTCFAGVEVVRVEAVLLFLIQGGQSGNGVLLPNICCKSHIFMAGLKPLLFPQLLLHRTRMLVIRLTAEFLHAFIAHQKRK